MADSSGSQGLSNQQKARLAGIAALVAVVIGLVLDNTDDVEIGWVLGESNAPLVVLLLVVWVAGVAIGWLAGRRRD